MSGSEVDTPLTEDNVRAIVRDEIDRYIATVMADLYRIRTEANEQKTADNPYGLTFTLPPLQQMTFAQLLA